jgi:membrane carboxypeptidase/penicillin-binding protein
VWLDFMKSALGDKPVLDFTVPDGISCVNIDPESGLRARDTEIDSVLECFKEGTEPVEFAPEWKVDPTQGPNTLILGEEPEPPAPLRPDIIEKYRTGQIFQ